MVNLFKKLLKWSLLLVLGVIVLVMLAYLLVDPKRYNDYITSQMEKAAASQGITLQLNEFSLNVRGVKARDLEAYFQRAFLGLSLSNVDVGFSLLKMMLGSLNGSLQADLYGGKVVGNSQIEISSRSGSGTFSLSEVKLNEHPQIAGLGITAGVISCNIPSFEISNGSLSKVEISLEMENVTKPLATTLPLPVQGTKIPFQIPSFTIDTLKGEAFIDTGLLHLNSFQFSSSLGSVEGMGELSLDGRSGSRHHLSFSITLSSDGLRHIGPYLPLLSRDSLTAETQCFGCDVERLPRGLVSACEPESCSAP